jgi:hypothetical protein
MYIHIYRCKEFTSTGKAPAGRTFTPHGVADTAVIMLFRTMRKRTGCLWQPVYDLGPIVNPKYGVVLLMWVDQLPSAARVPPH